MQLLHEADADPKIRELARGILQRQVNHAIRLVDDLLDLSRITQGTIALCKRDLAIKPPARAGRGARGTGDFSHPMHA